MNSQNETSIQRNVQRSVSESASSEQNEVKNSQLQRITRRSETFDNTRELEEIVTCCIHLGIMNDPRKLFCQHAFCYNCLKEYSKICVDLICPICRVKEKTNDIDKLPSALTEKQLISVVMKNRITKCIEDPQISKGLSDEIKEDLVQHLVKEINSNNRVYKVSKSDEVFVSTSSQNTNQITAYLESNQNTSIDDLTYEMMDIETIRENMLKYSQYEVVKRDGVHKICKNIHQLQKESSQFEFSIFDINISATHPKLSHLVLVDSKSHQLLVYSDSNIKTFHIVLKNDIIKPEYIRIYQGNLILTGRLDRNEEIGSIFLQCSMCGKILRQSELYIWPNTPDLPMMMGFDINEKEEKYYLCMPNSGSVRIYSTNFIESHQYYEFDENRPEYIAFSSTQNQLWISCPRNRRILILDLDSGIFRLFNTEQINKAIPKMIFVTDDEKIIFLDITGNRFIWIKRRNEYILTQKLNFLSINRDSTIKNFLVLPCSRVTVGVENEILVFQSTKYFSKSRRIFELCNFL